ncbi:zona pellucida-like domain-containing protein 1 [Engraulis encrasicolus]|uniref:zona pellucida-like domain-containing protein 1 n=1 Tax=Engraulis encrasicolus TaxID=184585 RepID=UPI002FD5B3FF
MDYSLHFFRFIFLTCIFCLQTVRMIKWKHLALLALAFHSGLAINCTTDYDRIPVNSDLTVDCGVSIITLEVNVCTASWAGFNASTLAMNGQHNNSLCFGVTDTSTNPPVVRFQLPINDSSENPCRQSLQIVDETPTSAVFSSFSKVQSVIITGFIDTPRSTEGIISYTTDLYYHFSCRYPLEYFINNTQIVASSVSVATKGNNGTFISTLSMSVYNDSNYMYPLAVPDAGLPLRSKIYVEVKATNLTGSFHVLLDHCFATPSPYNVSANEKHDFFTGCTVHSRTTIDQNGRDLNSRFYFEAFRFVEHHSLTKSTIYLHCIVRLCEPDKCQELLNGCGSSVYGRKRREVAEPFGSESSESTTVSVGPIYTRDNGMPILAHRNAPLLPHLTSTTSKMNEVDQTAFGTGASSQQADSSKSDTALAIGLIFGGGATVVLVVGAWFVAKKFLCLGGSGLTSFH